MPANAVAEITIVLSTPAVVEQRPGREERRTGRPPLALHIDASASRSVTSMREHVLGPFLAAGGRDGKSGFQATKAFYRRTGMAWTKSLS